MSVPQMKLDPAPLVEVSPDYDKLFDGDLATATGGEHRCQMTVGECERLLDSGAIGADVV